MASVVIVDAVATGRLRLAVDLSFEYMALTQGEAGLPVPQDFEALPAPLRETLSSLRQRHAPPGCLLLALHDEQVCGTVAMRPSPLTRPTDALVERLYVRESMRRQGAAAALMSAVHRVAEQSGFGRAVLSVMPTRHGAIAFYRAIGYTPLAQDVDWPWPAVWLCHDLGPVSGTAS
jgi:GNAT superfamily N-acetyltransferase